MKPLTTYMLQLLSFFLLQQFVMAQQPSLQVNYSRSVKLHHDEPVLLTISIVNKEAQENQRWNSAADRRLNELDELVKAGKISRDEYEKEKLQVHSQKKIIKPISLGSSEKPWYSLVNWKWLNTKTGRVETVAVRVLPNPSVQPVAELDAKGYYKVWFGIDPAELKPIPAGQYKITATIEGKSSEPVLLELQEDVMPGPVADSEEMILRIGKYHWHAGEAARGMAYADRLLRKNPNSLDGYSLRGDLYVLQKKYTEALNDYQAALKLFYKEYPGVGEPPEYLLEMINWVKTEIGK